MLLYGVSSIVPLESIYVFTANPVNVAVYMVRFTLLPMSIDQPTASNDKLKSTYSPH